MKPERLLGRLSHLLFKLGFQPRFKFELARQFIEIGFFHEVFLVHQHHAGDVHFSGHFRRAGSASDIRRVEGFVELGVQPVLQFLVVVELGEFTFDQLAFTIVDVAVGLGGGNLGFENGLTVLLGLHRRQAIEGLRLTLRGQAFLRVPVAVGFVGEHTQRSETTVNRDFATDLAGLFATDQQAHGTRRQGTTARAGEQATEAAGA